VVGGALQGSPDVFVNGRPALRVGDVGAHAGCCGPGLWRASAGSATVFINGVAAHRAGDRTLHCGGAGALVEGSADVLIGDSGAPADVAPGRAWIELVVNTDGVPTLIDPVTYRDAEGATHSLEITDDGRGRLDDVARGEGAGGGA